MPKAPISLRWQWLSASVPAPVFKFKAWIISASFWDLHRPWEESLSQRWSQRSRSHPRRAVRCNPKSVFLEIRTGSPASFLLSCTVLKRFLLPRLPLSSSLLQLSFCWDKRTLASAIPHCPACSPIEDRGGGWVAGCASQMLPSMLAIHLHPSKLQETCPQLHLDTPSGSLLCGMLAQIFSGLHTKDIQRLNSCFLSEKMVGWWRNAACSFF